MANPQTRKGFTKFPNKLFEKIIESKLNGTQYGIVLATIRSTYGYHIESKSLGLNFFAKVTGRHKRQIANELNTLIARKILIVKCEHTFGKSRELQLNEDTETWLNSS
ncbi:MAG: replication protein [Bacteroidota bacterium]|nr:replication protein [Bacteroidota bacterium]